MKILFLTNLLPYPLDNGGKIKSYTTLKVLHESGHEVDLLCFKETQHKMIVEEEKLLELCKSIHQIYLPLTTVTHKKYMINIAVKSLFSSLPFSIYKYKSKSMIQELIRREAIEYDIVYFDHLPLCIYLENIRKLWPNARIVLDEHNCETMIVKRKEQEIHRFALKTFLKMETCKLKAFERKSINSVDKTIVLSESDYSSLRKIVKKDFFHSIIPIGVIDSRIKTIKENEILNILYVGTLTWEPNNLGMIWFLKEVFPKLLEECTNFHLYIVGKNPSDEIVKLSSKYNSHITVTGYVESVEEYYEKCDCMIVPLFIGSGQRVKLIEAFSKGMPAISTTIGVEGLEYEDGETLLIANDEMSFVEAIKKMYNKEIRMQLNSNSRLVYENNYSPKAIENLICESLEDL